MNPLLVSEADMVTDQSLDKIELSTLKHGHGKINYYALVTGSRKNNVLQQLDDLLYYIPGC
jgi:hypothetical protein